MPVKLIARADNPKAAAREIDWINSRVGLLGESFSRAVREIEEMLADGTMIVVQEGTEE